MVVTLSSAAIGVNFNRLDATPGNCVVFAA